MKQFIISVALVVTSIGAWAFGQDPVLLDAQRANARGDYARELAITRPLAEKGVGWAQGMLGNSYFSGKGVPQDEQVAIALWKRSADSGQAAAQFNLGLLYSRDDTVFRDHRDQLVFKEYQEAVKWYRMAADNGHREARLNLGYMYYAGRGIYQDYAEAFKLYNSAATAGNAIAQYNVGYMYLHGQGVAQNTVEAIRWYRLAASNGNQLAKNALNTVNVR
jgi:uncharacterized protein